MANDKKVLIVEDDESVRRVLHNELEKQGVAVLEAENGEAAFMSALKDHPDLILLDVIMPKMHGMDLLRKLREDDWGKNVPIILLTNFADDPRVVEAVKEGRCELLSKAEAKLDDIIQKVRERVGLNG
ncbi:MAG: response regulator [Patescibacteria group bacterium]|nr:response regulator [Patescibacteria group bacterium]